MAVMSVRQPRLYRSFSVRSKIRAWTCVTVTLNCNQECMRNHLNRSLPRAKSCPSQASYEPVGASHCQDCLPVADRCLYAEKRRTVCELGIATLLVCVSTFFCSDCHCWPHVERTRQANGLGQRLAASWTFSGTCHWSCFRQRPRRFAAREFDLYNLESSLDLRISVRISLAGSPNWCAA